MERVGDLWITEFPNGTFESSYMAIDHVRGFMYITDGVTPGRVVRVDGGEGSAPPIVVDTLTLPSGYGVVGKMLLDTEGGYGYFITHNATIAPVADKLLVKVALGTSTEPPIVLGYGAIPSISGTIRTGEIDPQGGFAYFATNANGANIVKVALGEGNAAPEFVGTVTEPWNGPVTFPLSSAILPQSDVLVFTAQSSESMVVYNTGEPDSVPDVQGYYTIDYHSFFNSVVNPTNGIAYFSSRTGFGDQMAVRSIALARAGSVFATRMTMPVDGMVEDMRLYSHYADGNVRLAIYDDAEPKNLLWQSDEVANAITDGEIVIPVSEGFPGSLGLQAGTYWLAWQVDSLYRVPSMAGTTSTSNAFFYPHGFGPAPETIAQSDLIPHTESWSNHITFTPADLTPPISTVTAPVAATNQQEITLSFTVSDDNSGVSSTSLYVLAPGATEYVLVDTATGESGSFGYTMNVGDGEYGFTTISTDIAGNVEPFPTSPKVTVTLDTAPPTVVIVANETGFLPGAADAVTITFDKPVVGFALGALSLAHEGSPVSLVSAVLNGSGADYSLDLSAITQPDGDYTLTLTASGSGIEDTLGNVMVADGVGSWTIDSVSATPTILAVSPNPIGTTVEALGITFDKPVVGFTEAALVLRRDGVVVPTPSLEVLGSGLSYLVGLDQYTFLEGSYELSLMADGAGIANEFGGASMTVDASRSWVRNADGPEARVAPVLPSPRNTTVDILSITFSREVPGIEVNDFVLYRDESPVAGTMVLDGGPHEYTLDVSDLTTVSGVYRLELVPATLDSSDPGFILLTNSSPVEWLQDLDPPVLTFNPVTPSLRNTPVSSVGISFNEPVTGFDVSSLSLTRSGSSVPLTADLLTEEGSTWSLDLSELTDISGNYQLSFIASGSGVMDAVGNLAVDNASVSWTADYEPPTVTITNIGPYLRTSAGAAYFTFSEPISGFDITDLVLTRNGELVDISDLALEGVATSDYFIVLISVRTSTPGHYVLTLVAEGSGITDGVNFLQEGDSQSWEMDNTPLVATFGPVEPNPAFLNPGVITVNWNKEVVSGLAESGFSLTRDGSVAVVLDNAVLTGSGDTFFLDLSAVPTPAGNYVLTLNAPGEILDKFGNTHQSGGFQVAFDVEYTSEIGDFVFESNDITVLENGDQNFASPVSINDGAFTLETGSLTLSGGTVIGDGRMVMGDVDGQGDLVLVDGAFSINPSTNMVTVTNSAANAPLVISGVPFHVCRFEVVDGDSVAFDYVWPGLPNLPNVSLAGLEIVTTGSTREIGLGSEANFYAAAQVPCNPTLDLAVNRFSFSLGGLTLGSNEFILEDLAANTFVHADQIHFSELVLRANPLPVTGTGELIAPYGVWEFSDEEISSLVDAIIFDRLDLAGSTPPLTLREMTAYAGGLGIAESVDEFSFGSLQVNLSGNVNLLTDELRLGTAVIGGSRPATMNNLLYTSTGYKPMGEVTISTARFQADSLNFNIGSGQMVLPNATVFAGSNYGFRPAGNVTVTQTGATLSALNLPINGLSFITTGSAGLNNWSININLALTVYKSIFQYNFGNRVLNATGLNLNMTRCDSGRWAPNSFGFVLGNVCLDYFMGDGSLKGTAQIVMDWGRFGNFNFINDITFRDRRVSSIGTDLGSIGSLELPIGSTGAALNRLKANMFNLSGLPVTQVFQTPFGSVSQTFTPTPEFRGYAEMSNFAPVTIWTSQMQTRIHGSGMTADGTGRMFGTIPIGDGSLLLKWGNEFFARLTGRHEMTAMVKSGTLQVQRTSRNTTSYSGQYAVTLIVPSGVPHFGGKRIGGLTAGVGGEDAGFWVSVSACVTIIPRICVFGICTPQFRPCLTVRVTSSGDFNFSVNAKEWESLRDWERPISSHFLVAGDELVPIDAVDKSSLDGTEQIISFLGNARLAFKEYYNVGSTPKSGGFTQSVTLPAGKSYIVRVVYQTEGGDPTFTVTNPAGFTHTPLNSPDLVVAENGAVYRENLESREASYLIAAVDGGDYLVEVLNPQTLGDFTIEVIDFLPEPSVRIHDVAIVGDEILVEYTVDSPNGPAVVEFFLDRDTRDSDGSLLLTQDLQPLVYDGITTTTTAFTISQQSLPPGRQFVYATIDDGNYAFATYSDVSLFVPEPMAPAHVENLRVLQMGGTVLLTWDLPEPDPLLVGWNIYYTSDPASSTPQLRTTVGPQETAALLSGFELNKTYTFLVTSRREYVITLGTKSLQNIALQEAADLLATTGKGIGAPTLEDALGVVETTFANKNLDESGMSHLSLAQQALEMVRINHGHNRERSASFEKAIATARMMTLAKEDDPTTMPAVAESAFTAYDTVETLPAAGENGPPVIASTPEEYVLEGEDYVYQVVATDPDGDPITFALLDGPVGMTISSTGLVEWLSADTYDFADLVVIEASDNQGNSATQSFPVALLSLPPAPTLAFTSYPTLTAGTSSPWIYTPTYTTDGEGAITFELLTSPSGMTIGTEDGVMEWTTPATEGAH
ncbi:MAG: hypothetical protein JJU11_10500, partial [Candidatus Sumerlaeia bacterium]|nr:hypothetical protein [Candidatus Sumerlaeia bacterium]